MKLNINCAQLFKKKTQNTLYLIFDYLTMDNSFSDFSYWSEIIFYFILCCCCFFSMVFLELMAICNKNE